jgi:hypothetical protein
MSIQLVERSTSIAGRAMLLAALLAAASLTQAQTEQAPANEAHRILDEAVKKTAAMPAWTSDIEMKMSMMGLFEMVMTGATTNKDKLSRMNLKGKLDLGDPTMIMEMGMAMIVDKARTMWIEMEMNVGEMPQKMVMKGDVAKLTALSGEATALNAATPLGGDFNALQQINPETVAQYKKSFDLTAKGEQELDGAAVYVIEARMKKDARDRANAAWSRWTPPARRR